MKNKRDFVFRVRDLKDELAEAYQRGLGLTGKEKELNDKYKNDIVNEILRLTSIIQEEENRITRGIIDAKELEITFEFEKEDDSLRQASLVTKFRANFKEIYNNYNGTSLKPITESQRRSILDGMRDRIGIEITQDLMKTVNSFNFNQASELIKVIKTVSFINMRRLVSKGIKKFRNDERYAEILVEANKNIFKMAWFEANDDIVRVITELDVPTDNQINMIANVSRYPETYEALVNMGIEISDFEHRVVKDGEEKPYYSMNWDRFKATIKKLMNREKATNFIQTYGYITNYYEGRRLEAHERNHLRNLYIQLGEYEKTRPSYLNVILKDNYGIISQKLEEQVRLNKVANSQASIKFRETMVNDLTRIKKVARETRSFALKKEQQEARDFQSFLFGMYAEVGQEIPEEARTILPYFVEGGEIKYATVEEQHYGELRRLVFEQREVIKQVDNEFNWGAFICNQPTHILRALGLEMLV